MTDRKEFEKFMFSMDGHNLYTKINSADMSANRFAWEIWQAATLAQQKKVEALEIQVQELREVLLEISRTRPTLSTTNEGIEVVVYFVEQNPTKIAREALDNTPNVSEWVRKDSLEVAGWQFYQYGEWFTGSDNNNHKENTIEAGFKMKELYRIKGE